MVERIGTGLMMAVKEAQGDRGLLLEVHHPTWGCAKAGWCNCISRVGERDTILTNGPQGLRSRSAEGAQWVMMHSFLPVYTHERRINIHQEMSES